MSNDRGAALALSLGVMLVALTAPLPAAAQQGAPLVRIAFGSCADEEAPQPIWDAVFDYKPELFIFAGDNVYGAVSSPAMAELIQAYTAAPTIPGYARVLAEVPVLATWDDHDYGANDGGAGFRYKEESQRLFLDFWGVPPGDPRAERAGVYHAETVGPPGRTIQVILLDTRYFRSPLKPTDEPGAPGKERYVPDPDPGKTMLGEEQWAWLEEQLRRPAALRLVVSSIQVIARGHGYERWGNLPAERRRLFDLIEETGAEGVVFLSGDRHFGAIYRLDEGVPYPLYEITSSGLNKIHPGADEPGPYRLGAIYGVENFGTVDIDWWAHEVTLALRGMNGEPVRRVTVPMSSLR